MPAATCSVLHDGRIFACEGQYVRWSAPGPYADIWPNDNEALIADAYGNITGLAQVGGVLVVFKRNSIWVGQPSGEDEGYTFYPVPGSVGCCAPKSIATTGNVVVFLAEDGFYTFDGQTVKKISSQLGKLIEDGWASTVENGQAVFASAYNHYRFFYSDTGSSTCLDSALYCDLGQETPSWWRQKPTSGFAATALAVDTTSDVNQMVFGDKYGVIWDADTGIADRIDQWVTASLDTHRLGLGSAQKAIFRWASPTTENDGNFDWYVGLWPDGDSTARVDHLVNKYNGLTATGEVFLDGETFTDTGTFVEAPSHAIGQCSFAAAGRWFQLRLSHDKPSGFVLEAIECEVVPTGKRGAR
jgi:hypothetical protein